MRNVLLALVFPLLLGACGAESVWAPEEQVQAALYRHDGPPSITLFTMVNNRSNEGAHSGLMINSTHRVMFDPAGSFKHSQIPERNDVLFGMSNSALDYYIDYHARETFRVVAQEVVVTPEQAAIAMRLVQENGPVSRALCSNSITRVLRQVPGFENIKGTPFPGRTMKQFSKIPGVKTKTYYDDSPDDRADLRVVQALE